MRLKAEVAHIVDMVFLPLENRHSEMEKQTTATMMTQPSMEKPIRRATAPARKASAGSTAQAIALGRSGRNLSASAPTPGE